MPPERTGTIGGRTIVDLPLREIAKRNAEINRPSSRLADAVYGESADAVRSEIRAHITTACFRGDKTVLHGVGRIGHAMGTADMRGFGFRREQVEELGDAYAIEMFRAKNADAGTEAGILYELIDENDRSEKCADFLVCQGDVEEVTRFYRETIGQEPPRERVIQLLQANGAHLLSFDEESLLGLLKDMLHAAKKLGSMFDRALLRIIANFIYGRRPETPELATLAFFLDGHPKAPARLKEVFGIERVEPNETSGREHNDIARALRDPNFAAWKEGVKRWFERKFGDDVK